MSLTQKKCVPCEGNVVPLSDQQARELLKHVPEWEMVEDASLIVREYPFEDFASALVLVNKIGELAEKEGHHPDVAFGWGYCSVALQTHSIDGLHENDFIMAAKIDEIARNFSK